MAKFIVKFNNEVVDHIDLVQGDMKIGRRPGSDIHLDNLAVSGTHANVFTIGDDSFIEDLASTNGTLVNNKKITKHHLHSGDNVVIGKHELIYVTDEQAEAPTVSSSNDFAKTVIINPGAAAGPAPSAPAPSANKSASRPAAIFVLSGANSGKRIDLVKSVTSLGRTGRKSGTISKNDEGYRLAPVPDSDDAPTLNGRPIPAGGVPLKNGDVIEVAGTRLQFYYK
jgi:pSer/pThr/pTyr-binding forkhead associated (FHA) protein